MSMFISTITDRGATPGLVKTVAFTQERLKMIAENVANMHTPGYRTKQLDVAGFQRALGDAFAQQREHRGSGRPFTVENGDQVRTDEQGRLRVTPSLRPSRNVLAHDGTNMSIERQMADLAETGMTNDLATTLLRGKYDGLRKAIRGTV